MSFRKALLFLSVGLGLWNGYLTVAWLVSSRPFGAIYPAVLAAFFLHAAISSRKFETPTLRRVWVLGGIGLAAAVGIAVLWVVANVTGDREYHHQAVGLSFWGGFIALLPLTMAVLWIHPKSRARILARRNDDRDATDEQPAPRGQ